MVFSWMISVIIVVYVKIYHFIPVFANGNIKKYMKKFIEWRYMHNLPSNDLT